MNTGLCISYIYNLSNGVLTFWVSSHLYTSKTNCAEIKQLKTLSLHLYGISLSIYLNNNAFFIHFNLRLLIETMHYIRIFSVFLLYEAKCTFLSFSFPFLFFSFFYQGHTCSIWRFPCQGSNQSCICKLHHSSQQCRILNPLSEDRDRTCILMGAIQICFH